MDEAARLWAEYLLARGDAPAQMAAWSAFITYLATNPTVWVTVQRSGMVFNVSEATLAALTAAVEAALVKRGLAVAVEKAAERKARECGLRLFIVRTCGTLSRFKPPPNQLGLVITIGILISTAVSVRAEGLARQAAIPHYLEYLKGYLVFVLKFAVGHRDRLPRLVPPKDFEEFIMDDSKGGRP